MIPKAVGCLLAHTMGLGKTLQIIAFLITLSLVPSDVVMDMPARLKRDNKRYLVICPPGIVANWRNEFKTWTPANCKDALGEIYICQSDPGRMRVIERWHKNGGVLLSNIS
jgi:SNF2 family DNA or RNA helicase